MESALVAAAALRVSASECDELERIVDAAERATTWAEFHSADRHFHRRCAELSGLVEATSYQTTYEMLARYFLPYPLDRLGGSHQEHRAIVDALRAADGSRAAAISRNHVGSLRRDMFMALPR
ncbi:FCD domain-containing protein [Leucobacter coleopterorum]|uniref:FCD domain-containing protein n=1 Tax=Leucobacter coleopterorum TaxID=2714933 RepID=A0ABX6JU83_9MICO|nr:FCD domain-containing protein [Leucobacter coleopterorum]QIM17856.1 FCD domain-containing protein [Leucobacter coleopterorum]